LFAFKGGGNCSEIDAIFLIDSSLSVRELCPIDVDEPQDNWSLILKFVSEVVGEMSKPLNSGAARVGIITYSTSVSVDDVVGLGQLTDASTLRRRISQLPFLGGNTNTTGALRLAHSQLRAARSTATDTKTSRKQYVILLTDGANNVDAPPVQIARLLKLDDIRLIIVGISEYVDEAQLKEMASAPADYSYIYASDFSHLNRLVGQLLDRLLCSIPPPAQRKTLVVQLKNIRVLYKNILQLFSAFVLPTYFFELLVNYACLFAVSTLNLNY